MAVYKQTTRYTTQKVFNDKQTIKENWFQRYINVLPQKQERKVLYDKELKIHFESLETYTHYEIEIEDILLNLASEISKAKDFHRRLNYKYDWIQIEKCSNGKITQFLNVEELQNSWNKLKQVLSDDYLGEQVRQYLKDISDKFTNPSHFYHIFNQYTEYGLLFCGIPDKHQKGWKKDRRITLNHCNDTELTETIQLIEEQDNKRIYSVELNRNENSPLCKLEIMKGELIFCTQTQLILHADVNVCFSYDNILDNIYHFELKKIN